MCPEEEILLIVDDQILTKRHDIGTIIKFFVNSLSLDLSYFVNGDTYGKGVRYFNDTADSFELYPRIKTMVNLIKLGGI